MTSKLVTLVVGICLLSLNAQAKHYCAEDSDCSALGDLVCTKSQCDWGICGCPRGQVAKFVGSDLKFKCITLKKIGQSCSTSGTGGICGPSGSACEDNICKCTGFANSVPIWDGERCSGDNPFPGETCDGNCEGVGVSCTVGRQSLGGDAGFEGLARTCTCPTGQNVAVSNDLDSSETYYGRSVPTCVPNLVGDFCLKNEDCPGANVECVNRECTCTDNTNPVWNKTSCATEGDKDYGAECDPISEPDECDPTKNLVCGDVCNLDSDYEPVCTCAPGFTRSGSNCVAVEPNADCVGDYNCKSLGPNAVCVNGQCKSNSMTILGSIWLIALGFTLSRWF